jgi:hypothetical protein
MTGHMRFRAGAWRFTVEGPRDPVTRNRKPVYRTFHAPSTKAGKTAAGIALAEFVTEVNAGKVLAGAGVTTGQMLVQWVELRRTEWEEKSPGQPDDNLARVRKHLIPHIGDIPVLTKKGRARFLACQLGPGQSRTSTIRTSFWMPRRPVLSEVHPASQRQQQRPETYTQGQVRPSALSDRLVTDLHSGHVDHRGPS